MIIQELCDSFKSEILQKGHDITADTFKLALYDSSASLDRTTTVYSTTNEITDSGYTAGGKTLTGGAVTLDSGVAVVDFDDAVWTSASFTTRGGLIYNTSNSNKAVAVLNFGIDQVSTITFTYQFPNADAASGIIRIT